MTKVKLTHSFSSMNRRKRLENALNCAFLASITLFFLVSELIYPNNQRNTSKTLTF